MLKKLDHPDQGVLFGERVEFVTTADVPSEDDDGSWGTRVTAAMPRSTGPAMLTATRTTAGTAIATMPTARRMVRRTSTPSSR